MTEPEALPGLNVPAVAPAMRRSAVLSDDGVYRYRLGRRWADGPTVAWIMLNPSTADAAIDDPTIRRCIGFSRAWGYGALEVVNLFAYRATKPTDMAKATDPVGPDNDAHIAAACRESLEVIVAWGAHPAWHRRWEALNTAGVLSPLLSCLGTSQAGAPLHPLYLPKTSEREPWPS